MYVEIEEISRAMKTSSSSTARRHEHHADGAELNEREEFAQALSLRCDGVENDEERSQNDAGDEDVEEDAEGVGADDAIVGGAGRQLRLPEAGGQSGERGENGEPAERFAARGFGHHRVSKHHDDAAESEKDFRSDAREIVHCPPPDSESCAGTCAALAIGLTGVATDGVVPERGVIAGSMALIQ